MLHNWIFRHWKHNNNRANLTPITKTKHKPYWYYLIYALIPYVGLVYSYPGIIHDIFPNLPIIKQDRQQLSTKKRAFDTLIMSHKQQNTVISKCQNKSLF